MMRENQIQIKDKTSLSDTDFVFRVLVDDLMYACERDHGKEKDNIEKWLPHRLRPWMSFREEPLYEGKTFYMNAMAKDAMSMALRKKNHITPEFPITITRKKFQPDFVFYPRSIGQVFGEYTVSEIIGRKRNVVLEHKYANLFDKSMSEAFLCSLKQCNVDLDGLRDLGSFIGLYFRSCFIDPGEKDYRINQEKFLRVSPYEDGKFFRVGPLSISKMFNLPGIDMANNVDIRLVMREVFVTTYICLCVAFFIEHFRMPTKQELINMQFTKDSLVYNTMLFIAKQAGLQGQKELETTLVASAEVGEPILEFVKKSINFFKIDVKSTFEACVKKFIVCENE